MKTKMQAFLIRTKEMVSKRLMMILLTLGIASGAYAQHFHGGEGGHFGGGVRTGIIARGYGGYGGFGSYWGWGYPGLYLGYGYPFIYGFPGYGGYGGASRLQMQLSDIKQDYADRIESVRSDMSLTGKERRQKVRELRRERDHAVDSAKRNYWRGPSGNGNAPANNSNAPAGNGNAPAGNPSSSGQNNQNQ
jgi:hypothetical protein